MKFALLPVLVVLVSVTVGCASSPSSLGAGNSATLQNMESACWKQRQELIRDAWRDYEMRNRLQVVFPDWRMQATAWARAECAYGRTIEQFRP
ncbi:MAG: hypothetical protein ACNA7W_18940 [Pseudomonadales bacterium]